MDREMFPLIFASEESASTIIIGKWALREERRQLGTASPGPCDCGHCCPAVCCGVGDTDRGAQLVECRIQNSTKSVTWVRTPSGAEEKFVIIFLSQKCCFKAYCPTERTSMEWLRYIRLHHHHHHVANQGAVLLELHCQNNIVTESRILLFRLSYPKTSPLF